MTYYSEARLVQVMERRGIGRPSTFAPTVKTLQERGYAEVQKRQLQATALGLEVDTFLQKALPELLEAEFTAQMEGKLDAIALGQEDWERYIIGWNEDYFAPALEKAMRGMAAIPRSDKIAPKGNAIAQGKESKTLCPQCGLKMIEVRSQSKKLHKSHFLKCSGCNTVMFYNKWRKVWELPGEKKEEPVPVLKLTAHACPICGEKLAVREYEKEGQQKRMLVCSSPQGRTDRKHKDVVYFESRNVFWSKKYGELSDGLLQQ
jgi:DNA topoisomerase-1